MTLMMIPKLIKLNDDYFGNLQMIMRLLQLGFKLKFMLSATNEVNQRMLRFSELAGFFYSVLSG